MGVKLAGAAIVVAVLTIVAYAIWFSRQTQTVVSVRTVKIEHEGRRAEVRVRVVERAGRRFDEVELPNGTWIDCASDCATAHRRAADDFWKELQLRGK